MELYGQPISEAFNPTLTDELTFPLSSIATDFPSTGYSALTAHFLLKKPQEARTALKEHRLLFTRFEVSSGSTASLKP